MIGKLNCDAFAHGSSGENSDFGTTLNPWNKNIHQVVHLLDQGHFLQT